MTLGELKSKRIAVVGLGVNNRKMADYFSNQGIGYEIIENWREPQELEGILDNFDVIFRTPGLPYLSGAVAQAKKAGVEISSQTKLFFDLCPATIIGVTGTKGKGTTASLIYEILKADGKKVYIAGNFGKDPFEFLDELTKDSFVIMELSSFQLQDLAKSPPVAVVLKITPDHLNHHKTLEEYVQAKSNILRYQAEPDFAILHKDLPNHFSGLGNGKKIMFDRSEVSGWVTPLLGEHNQDNIAAAAKAAMAIGIAEPVVKSAVASFKPLPHRLNTLGTYDGVSYIDDGYSTNIEPVLAAIDAVKTPMVLIIGGFDKGLDFTPVAQKIISSPNIKGLVIIGQVTDKILSALTGFGGKVLTGAADMPNIVAQAKSLAAAGDTVVFSPGTSSFDMFKNETDRSDQFVREVNNLGT